MKPEELTKLMKQYQNSQDSREKEELRRKIIKLTAEDRPEKPEDTLLSRRRSDFPDGTIQMRCDTIAFPLAEESTNPSIVKIIRDAQIAIRTLVDRDFGITPEMKARWLNDKALRRKEKPYKIQKNLHLSISGSVAPCSVEDYLNVKIGQRFIPEILPDDVKPIVPSGIENRFQEINRVLQDYVETGPLGTVRECKLNPDGHIVVRVDIDPADQLAKCREELSEAMGKPYVRYTEPEKQKTLAAVIAVVDYTRLSLEVREELGRIIMQLNKDLKQMGTFPLKVVVWREFENRRTISDNSLLRTREFRLTR